MDDECDTPAARHNKRKTSRKKKRNTENTTREIVGWTYIASCLSNSRKDCDDDDDDRNHGRKGVKKLESHHGRVGKG